MGTIEGPVRFGFPQARLGAVFLVNAGVQESQAPPASAGSLEIDVDSDYSQDKYRTACRRLAFIIRL